MIQVSQHLRRFSPSKSLRSPADDLDESVGRWSTPAYPVPNLVTEGPVGLSLMLPSPASRMDLRDGHSVLARFDVMGTDPAIKYGDRRRLRVTAVNQAADPGHLLQEGLDATPTQSADEAIALLQGISTECGKLAEEVAASAGEARTVTWPQDPVNGSISEFAKSERARRLGWEQAWVYLPDKILRPRVEGRAPKSELPYPEAYAQLRVVHSVVYSEARVIDLRHRNLQDAHIAPLLSSLVNIDNLQVLNLSCNEISTSGLIQLLAGLRSEHDNLVWLGAQRNLFDEKGERMLAAYNARLGHDDAAALDENAFGHEIQVKQTAAGITRRRVGYEHEGLANAAYRARHRTTLLEYSRRLCQVAAAPVSSRVHVARQRTWAREHVHALRRLEEMDLSNMVAGLEQAQACLSLLSETSPRLRHLDLSGSRLSTEDLDRWAAQLRQAAKPPTLTPTPTSTPTPTPTSASPLTASKFTSLVELRTLILRGNPYPHATKKSFAKAAHAAYPSLLSVKFLQEAEDPLTDEEVFAERNARIAEQSAAFPLASPAQKVPQKSQASALADETYRRSCFSLRERMLLVWETEFCDLPLSPKRRR